MDILNLTGLPHIINDCYRAFNLVGLEVEICSDLEVRTIMLVSVVKNWTYPDLLRQTPGGNGVWNNIRFTLEPVDKCDALLVLNRLREDLTICCPPENDLTASK